MIEFRVDARSGVPAYLQLVRQVEHAVRFGLLRAGDQLPTVKDVAGSLALNPNTVQKAYRELDHRGLTEGRVGQGTFIQAGVTSQPTAGHAATRRRLNRWVETAIEAGLTDEDIEAMVAEALRAARTRGAA